MFEAIHRDFETRIDENDISHRFALEQVRRSGDECAAPVVPVRHAVAKDARFGAQTRMSVITLRVGYVVKRNKAWERLSGLSRARAGGAESSPIVTPVTA